MWQKPIKLAYKTGRKLVIAVVGVTVVLFGVVLINSKIY